MVGVRASRRLAALSVVLCVAGACVAIVPAAPAKRRPAYCPLSPGPAHPDWAFHVNSQIEGPTGTYAHGHGILSGERAEGKICQVDRGGPGPDRQIDAVPTKGPVTSRKRVFVGGVEGNLLAIPIRVTSSTDARCASGARGTLTLFASFNGARRDTVRFAFGNACRDHDHFYNGTDVAVIVPK